MAAAQAKSCRGRLSIRLIYQVSGHRPNCGRAPESAVRYWIEKRLWKQIPGLDVLGQGNRHHNAGTLAGGRLDLHRTARDLGALTHVEQTETAALRIVLFDLLHVKTTAIIPDDDRQHARRLLSVDTDVLGGGVL